MKVLSRETVAVDMDFAFRWLAQPFPHQRPVSRAVVEDYKSDMRAGRWSLGEGMIVIGVRPNGSFLLAGHHRLTAVFELETVAVDMTVCFYEFDTDAEMLQFYASGTNKGKSMGLKDSLAVLGTASAVAVPPYILSAASAGVGLMMNGFVHRNVHNAVGRKVKSPEVMDRVLRALEGPIYSYYRLMDGAWRDERWMFKRSSVIAVALATLRAQPEKALPFWRAAIENDGLRKGEPAHTLRNYLTRRDSTEDRTYDYCCTVAACWNSHWKGVPRLNAGPVAARTEHGIVIAGTEWRGQGNVDALKALCIDTERLGVK